MNARDEVTEYIDKLFKKQPFEIQRDANDYFLKAQLSHNQMTRKMRFGKEIPDSLLDDIREYYDCYNTALNLIGADIELVNELTNKIWCKYEKEV